MIIAAMGQQQQQMLDFQQQMAERERTIQQQEMERLRQQQQAEAAEQAAVLAEEEAKIRLQKEADERIQSLNQQAKKDTGTAIGTEDITRRAIGAKAATTKDDASTPVNSVLSNMVGRFYS